MKHKFLTGILILCVLILAGSAYSDFGSFSGNSDYSSSSSTSSRSSGGSYSGSPPSRSERYSPSYNTGTNFGVIPVAGTARHSSSSDDDEWGLAFIVLVVIVFWVAVSVSREKRKAKREQQVILDTGPAITLRPIEDYNDLDPEFDTEQIKTLMSNLYVQMQDTWHSKDISSLRPYMTDAFYSQMDRQLDAFRKTGRTDYTERIAVLGVSLKGWRQSAGMDYITVGLNARIVSYVLDDRTGKLLSGDMNREKFMEYEIELCRKSGTITAPQTEGQYSATCPHCGAPLRLNASAQCEYCGSVITSVNTDWAICGMKGISQRTA